MRGVCQRGLDRSYLLEQGLWIVVDVHMDVQLLLV